jgi:hypothetical protein
MDRTEKHLFPLPSCCCVTSSRTWHIPLLRVYEPLPSNGSTRYTIFWNVTPFYLLEFTQVSEERLKMSSRLHGVTFQKTMFFERCFILFSIFLPSTLLFPSPLLFLSVFLCAVTVVEMRPLASPCLSVCNNSRYGTWIFMKSDSVKFCQTVSTHLNFG